jgi:hypothetical protein
VVRGRGVGLFLALLLPALVVSGSRRDPLAPLAMVSDSLPYPLPSRPYLRVAPAPPLRFYKPLPPPESSVRPPGGPPPRIPDSAPAKPDVILPKPAAVAAIPSASPTLTAGKPATTTPSAPSAAPAAAILHDDVPSRASPEDFLPYFQYPGSDRRTRGTDAPASEAPPLPRSTATYTEGQ